MANGESSKEAITEPVEALDANLELSVFWALLGVQVVYSVNWQTGFEGIVTTSMIRLCVEIFVKGILLFLCIQFG